MERTGLRRSKIAARDALTGEERMKLSEEICRRIAASDSFEKAETVLLYKGIRGEVRLDWLETEAARTGKRIAYPLCISESEMAALIPGSEEAWKDGYCGIREPRRELSEEIPPEEIDLVICPCTVFDEAGGRMGMGAGFYDRYLPRCTNAHITAAAFEVQKAEKVEMQPHDVRMETVFTEKKTYAPLKEKIRKIILDAGADVCGFAGIDRFAEAEAGFGPADIWPGCRSVICLGVSLPKGLSYVSSRLIYARYNGLALQMADAAALRGAKKIEMLGGTAVPLPGDGPYEHWDAENAAGKGLISVKEAAVKCGLGQLGKNTMLLSPQAGSMLNLSVILTDLELESDPYAENICIPGCRRCLDSCPGHAISEEGHVDQKICRETCYHKTAKGFSTVDCNLCRTVCPVRFGVL
ncbi:MAG: 5-formyltetrahydrofolate cyclo-ligase [Emergencia sp.]